MTDQQTAITKLKKELNQTVSKKGKLSRKIGALKKSGQAIDDVLVEMKEVSAKTKSLEAELKHLNERTNITPKPQPPEPFPLHISRPACQSSETPSCHYHIKIVSTEMAKAWNKYVRSHPASCAYHLFDFKLIIEQSFQHPAYYIAALMMHSLSLAFSLLFIPKAAYSAPTSRQSLTSTTVAHFQTINQLNNNFCDTLKTCLINKAHHTLK